MRINGLWTLPDNGYTLVNFEQTTKNTLKYLTTLLADLLNRLEYRFGIFKKKLSLPVRSPCFAPTACFYAISGCFALAAAALALALASLKVKFINLKFSINENAWLKKGGLMC